MFGFLIKGEVNDDAVKLKTFAEMAVKKYAHLSFDEAKKAVESDFDEGKRYIDEYHCTWIYDELPDFQFILSKGVGDEVFTLMANGRAKYAGFMLHVGDIGEQWYASVQDGISYRATGGAKKLIQLMGNKFGVENMDKVLGQLGIL